jgi:hypothetical protein
MLNNPPPDTCDHCRRAGPEWRRVDGPDRELVLADGRKVTRGGRVYVCGSCGHTVPISIEGPRMSWIEVAHR